MALSGISESLRPIQFKGIEYSNLVRIPIIGDGSCFFHAILRSFYRDYIESTQHSVRQYHARNLRYALAEVLDESNPLTGKKYYDELSRGTLSTLASEGLVSCSLLIMQKELQQDGPVDNLYHELVSNHLNRDVYIINEDIDDVDVGFSDLELLYKGRNSIVLLFRNSHFELLGIAATNSGLIETLFTPSHPLIQQLYDRMLHLINIRIGGHPICYVETSSHVSDICRSEQAENRKYVKLKVEDSSQVSELIRQIPIPSI
jgi:hypothetical protein